eukprot:351532-Chlamydomonas_euryale.AAC.17
MAIFMAFGHGPIMWMSIASTTWRHTAWRRTAWRNVHGVMCKACRSPYCPRVHGRGRGGS